MPKTSDLCSQGLDVFARRDATQLERPNQLVRRETIFQFFNLDFEGEFESFYVLRFHPAVLLTTVSKETQLLRKPIRFGPTGPMSGWASLFEIFWNGPRPAEYGADNR